MDDLIEHNVTLTENLELKRKPIPEMDAVYFISPTEHSVDILLKDFKDKKKPQYKAAHVWFASHVNDDLMKKIGDHTNLMARLVALEELYVDFLAYEGHTFHLDRPDALLPYFSPEYVGQLPVEIEETAAKLTSLCYTLGEIPFIRYAQSSSKCEKLAQELLRRLNALKEMDEQFTKRKKGVPATLLLMDRSVDPLSPILHEFSYQAMCYDVLDVDPKVQTLKNSNKDEPLALTEQSTANLWTKLRHDHIAEVTDSIVSNFNEFLSSNAAQNTANVSAVTDLSDLAQIIKRLPQYKETLSTFSAHIDVLSQLFGAVKARRLLELAEWEQNLATAVDSEGNSLKAGASLAKILPLLRDPSMSVEDKLRLLMTFFVTQEELNDKQRNELFDIAKLSPDDQNAITNLRFLGVSLRANKKSKKAREAALKKKYGKDEFKFPVSRYVPPLRDIVEEGLQGKLNEQAYPYMGEIPIIKKTGKNKKQAAASQNPSQQSSSYRTNTLDFLGRTQEDTLKDAIEEVIEEQDAAPFIVFIAGGVTYSEMKLAYQMSGSNPVFVGGSFPLCPTSYVDLVRRIKKRETL